MTAINASNGFVLDQAMIARLVIELFVGIALFTKSRNLEWLSVLGVLVMMVWRISAQSVQ